MLLSKNAVIYVNNRNYKYYTDKGYIIDRYLDKDKIMRVKKGTKLVVDIEDLPLISNAMVEVKCDYCGEIITKTYRKMFLERNKIEKDCCNNCKSKKTQEINLLKYGTISQIELSKIKGYKTGRKLKYTISDIKEILMGKGLILDENLIISSNISVIDKLPFICNKHIDKGVQFRSLDQIIHSDTCCKYEGFELRSGENNNKWNGGVTSDNEKIRKSLDYINWRNSIFERDNYTCQCCGDDVGGNLQAHHIVNFSEFEDLRFDITNGICLCVNCHNPSIYGSFHHTYGTFNNNAKQLDEYIKLKQLESQQDSLLLCSNE